MTPEAGYMLTQIVELKHHLDMMGWLDWKMVLIIGAVLFILAFLSSRYNHEDLVSYSLLIVAAMFLIGLFALDVYWKEVEYETLCTAYRAMYGPLPWDVIA